jgi:hypothetical protein
MSMPVVSAVLLFTGAVCFVIGAGMNLWMVLHA